MKFHHIGIATENIDKMVEKIEKYFEVSDVSKTVYDEQQDADLCMVTLKGGIRIELITGEVVKNILKKRQYLYHTCYSVKDIDETIEKLVADGAFVVREARKAILFDNRRVAFLSWDLGLMELVEEE